MRRTHAMTPLTPQEESVRKLLVNQCLNFEPHHVFQLPSSRLAVDFLIFQGAGVVIECTTCSSRRGRALAEVKRRSSYMDYRFRSLKEAFPKLVCGALVEAQNENQEVLMKQLKPVLINSDFQVCSLEQLSASLGALREEESA
jgi:hypothetical protein